MQQQTMLQNTVDILSKYNVDPQFGFLPGTPPLQKLPEAWAAWDDLGNEMSGLLQAGAFCRVAERLPVLSINKLVGPEKDRALLLLAMFGHAFQWENPDGTGYLPEGIAVPWVNLADKMDRPPILTHGSIVLQNWKLIDPNAPLTLDNICTIHQFFGGIDEAGFYLLTVALEKAGAPALAALVEAQQAVTDKNEAAFIKALKTVVKVQQELNIIMARMNEKCDPYIFFNRVRPFLASFTDVNYKGVDGPIRSYHGGSAAQSSLLQSIDAALGIDHTEPRAAKYLMLMRDFMPIPHRRFIQHLEEGPSIRAFAESHAETSPVVEEAVKELYEFRQLHLEMVAEYIMKQGSKSGPGATGTGGTNPMIFCKQVRNDTT
jgi:indoleamine 2,3-dioxygenase